MDADGQQVAYIDPLDDVRSDGLMLPSITF
jgi:hypothetical protein